VDCARAQRVIAVWWLLSVIFVLMMSSLPDGAPYLNAHSTIHGLMNASMVRILSDIQSSVLQNIYLRW
jgi:hypothetical protein